MDPISIGIYSFAVLLLMLLVQGMPVGFVMALVGFVGYWMIAGFDGALHMIGMVGWEKVTSYTFTVVPLFVLMGNLAYHCRFGQDIFDAARAWVGHLPGGLAQGTVLANAFFGAATGSTVAAAATMAKIAVPEMEKYGYQNGLAVSSVAASGTMASMIPPSIAMALYGMVNEQSIARLLMAGILPGLVMAFSYTSQIWLRCSLNPRLGPALPAVTWKERLISLKGVAWIGAIFLIVMGSIYTGICTPTEAGALGASGTLILGFASRRLTLVRLWEALRDTARTVGMIFAVAAGAFIYNGLVAVSRLPDISAEFMSSLPVPSIGILIAILFFYLILGAFMDGVAMMFLTMPTIFPIVLSMGWNPIWFGVLFIHVYEMGMITPPFGLTLFACEAVLPNVNAREIMIGRVPFIFSDVCVLAVLICFPQIALFIPGLMS